MLVHQDVSVGEVRDDRGVVMSIKSRRKLGRKLTIAWCRVEAVGAGEVEGGASVGEELDMVCMGEVLAKVFAKKAPDDGAWHAFGSVVVEAKRSRSGRRVARVASYGGPEAARERAAAPEVALAPKKDRAHVFAAWLEDTLGRGALRSVVDVRVGQG